MRSNLINLGSRFAVVLLLAISLSSGGCKDSVSVSEDVEVPLSSLSVTPGTLQPAFFSNTTNYKVNAPTSALSVTVTAVPKANTDTMTINGVTTTSGQGRSIPLGAPGSITTIVIVVFSQTGLETTYTINVTRLLSSDDNLSALSVTQGTLKPSPFDANTLDYTVDVQTGVPSVTVVATKSDKDATVVISSAASSVTAGPGVNPGQLLVTLGDPGTTAPVSIEVTAPNGNQKTYTLSIKRLSGNSTLSALIVTANAVAHPVDLNTPPPYTVNVATNVTKVDVSATKSDPNAVMAIGSVTVPAGIASGSAPNLPLGAPGSDTPISILVTAQNGVDSTTYTVRVHRAASDDSTLSALSVAPGSLDPSPFDPNQVTYTVSVDNSVNNLLISATKSDPQATMSALGSVIAAPGTPSGPVIVPLSGTITEVVILVIAQDMTSQTSYTITVIQSPPAPTP